ncbi:MAG: UDP-N-acetylmuramate--L-alanine ligase [Rikenellaceae bacterium]|nr:UDP-N-acetylmuramate--L-alanine ligase [Rikenellaceae bacterium]
MAVAGTHGKTTTTTLVAWLNWMAGCNDIDHSLRCHASDTPYTAPAPGSWPRTQEPAGTTPAGSKGTTTSAPIPATTASAGTIACEFSATAPGFEPEVLRSAGLAPCCTGSAFLGGISKNFGSNLVLGDGPRLAVEADEFDRSFLQLYPDAAVITAADADHLDIYGTHEAVREAFTAFAGQIKPGGTLIVKLGVDLPVANPDIQVYTYAYDRQADFYATNVTLLEGGYYEYDIVCPDRTVRGCRLGIPGWVNVENSVAAVALLWVAGFDEERLKEGLRTFRGVQRRFDFWVNTPTRVYMDDYAHHPRELHAAITSVKRMFPGRRLTAVFQPHLYTRTRDFHTEFAEALSEADEVILLPIYPAREEPIEGIRSEIILDRITSPHEIVEKENLLQTLQNKDLDILVTFGAGDIDRLCADIAQIVARKA